MIMAMKLLPQDAVVVLKIALQPRESTLAQIAADLGMSGSQVHYAVERARVAGLLVKSVLRVNVPNALESIEARKLKELLEDAALR
jgi:hypothetical protein